MKSKLLSDSNSPEKTTSEKITSSRLQDLRKHFLGWPLLLSAFIIATDQWSKWETIWATDNIEGTTIKPVITNWFSLVHVRNKGAAWGMFNEHTWLLALLSLVFGLYVLWDWKSLCEGTKFKRFVMALLLGGVWGNWIDRQFYPQGVVDMIQVWLPCPSKWETHIGSGQYQFPAFNIADAAICVATFLYIGSAFFGSDKKAEEVKNTAPADTTS